ncbi:hypothetical protein LYZ86_08205 [Xanthomonas hortorum pv. cynarae]|uniref:hypothetical protein n=1 Tax=Xanthomonas hortorum TaxID=56454 RepID=UPI0011B03801|nr:hypothetical protein [Xanthomonas hortorum]MCE4349252.1 hypothetical protein [Xanthomonas hortorum pv. cynarae]CAD0319611.1 hypothetical protein CFBP2044_15330 [Xanthomonas hortorum pv. cynarae]CAD0319620.1 hypothetical protein CFBP2044_15330 [Xanthomonas hortorum pv. cynarae]
MINNILDDQIKRVEQLKNIAQSEISRLARVNGVGITWHNEQNCYALQINLFDNIAAELPREFRGVPIIYHIMGPITLRRSE